MCTFITSFGSCVKICMFFNEFRQKYRKLYYQCNIHYVLLTAVCGALLIYISTDYVFDGRNPPYGEDDSPNPLNVYGRSKLEGEREALRHCPGTCLLV